MKKSYQTPQLTVHGTVAQITQQTTKGSKINKTLIAGQPITLPLSILS